MKYVHHVKTIEMKYVHHFKTSEMKCTKLKTGLL